jgi:hypothetical protein
MSQDRILGSSALLQIYGSSGPVSFAELDSFTAKDQTELKKFRPLGQVQPHGQLVFGGYELSFKGAKVDDAWDQIQQANDLNLLNGKAAPRYRIVETTTWFSGNVETWTYDHVLIYGLNVDKASAGEEIKQDFSGFAPTRTSGTAGSASNAGLISGEGSLVV